MPIRRKVKIFRRTKTKPKAVPRNHDPNIPNASSSNNQRVGPVGAESSSRQADDRNSATELEHHPHIDPPAPGIEENEPKLEPSLLPFSIDDYQNGDFTFPQPFYTPTVQCINISTPSLSTPEQPYRYFVEDLLNMEYLGNPMIIFGQPFSGKTSIFMKLLEKSFAQHGDDHWIRLVDLSQWNDIFVAPQSDQQKLPKTFMELLAKQFMMPEKAVREKFRPLPNAKQCIRKKKYSKLVRGELFLDGFEDIPPCMRDGVLELLSTMKQPRFLCPIRIWISSRTHLKSKLLNVFGDTGAFEILPLPKTLQVDLLYQRWKVTIDMKKEEDKMIEKKEKLKGFSLVLYNDLENMIPDFDTTLGSVPLYLQILADIFRDKAKIFMTQNEKPCIVLREIIPANSASLTLGELFEKIAFTIAEYHCLKVKCKKFRRSGSLLFPAYHNLLRSCAKYAVVTYPTYQFDTVEGCLMTAPQIRPLEDTLVFRNLHFEDELLRFGLVIVNEDGILQFVNKRMGDFFLGRYFSLEESLDSGDKTFITFFLRVLLFDKKAAPVRAFFDNFISFQTMYDSMFIYDFLVKQYKLDNAEEWEKIRDNGNVWHLLVTEGLLRIAQILSASFFGPGSQLYMKRFFRMRAPLEIIGHISDPNSAFVHDHYMSSLSLLALFGHGCFVMRHLQLFVTIYGEEEVSREFHGHGTLTFTPLHYAAMHSNLWFIEEMFRCKQDFKLIQLERGVLNCFGQLPMHLLMSRYWHYTLCIKDYYMPEYDVVEGDDSGMTAVLSTLSAMPLKPKIVKAGPGPKGGKTGTGFRIGQLSSPKPGTSKQLYQSKPSSDNTDRPFRTVITYREMVKELNRKENKEFRRIHLECVRHFVGDQGEDINAPEVATGCTLLHLAATCGQLETVALLILLGTKMDLQDNMGKTALHYAALCGHKFVFLCLVRHGASIFVKDNDGITPFQLWKDFGEALQKDTNCNYPVEHEVKFFQICNDLHEKMMGTSKKSLNYGQHKILNIGDADTVIISEDDSSSEEPDSAQEYSSGSEDEESPQASSNEQPISSACERSEVTPMRLHELFSKINRFKSLGVGPGNDAEQNLPITPPSYEESEVFNQLHVKITKTSFELEPLDFDKLIEED